MTTTTTHPSGIDLEAFACGDAVAHVATHLDACDACRAYVDSVRGVAAEPPKLGAMKLLADARRVERSRRVIAFAAVAAPFAIAAGALLYLGARSPGATTIPATPATTLASGAGSGPAGTPSAADSLAMLDPSSEPETTFKGGMGVAVVRERAGAQSRFTGTVTVHTGDRLRVEVALDRPQAILGAVLGDDGSWLEIMPEAVRGPGTHFSEKSARVDAQPLRGTILVGPPEAVRRARATGKPGDGVVTMRIDWGDAP